MIISDTSFVPLPGKDAEAVAAFQEIAAHFDTRWPLAEHERQVAEQGADETVRALVQKVTPLAVPGSRRDKLRRVA
jgi:hypothetical protein